MKVKKNLVNKGCSISFSTKGSNQETYMDTPWKNNRSSASVSLKIQLS